MSVLPIDTTARPRPDVVPAENAAPDSVLISVQEVTLATTANLASPVRRRRWLSWLGALVARQHTALVAHQDTTLVAETSDLVMPSYVPPLRPAYMEQSAMLREMRRL